MSNGTELIPCPLCGSGETKIVSTDFSMFGINYGKPMNYKLIHDCFREDKSYPPTSIVIKRKTEQECIKTWNTRL